MEGGIESQEGEGATPKIKSLQYLLLNLPHSCHPLGTVNTLPDLPFCKGVWFFFFFQVYFLESKMTLLLFLQGTQKGFKEGQQGSLGLLRASS